MAAAPISRGCDGIDEKAPDPACFCAGCSTLALRAAIQLAARSARYARGLPEAPRAPARIAPALDV